MFTDEDLRRCLCYNPHTGVFTWAARVSRKVNIGAVAGSSLKGYIRVRAGRRAVYAHRLAFLFMSGEMPAGEVDHINGNPADNRWENLRLVTHVENFKNLGVPKTNTTGIMGVYWNRERRKWSAEIWVDRKKKKLAYTADFFEACCARRSAELRLGFHDNHGQRPAYSMSLRTN